MTEHFADRLIARCQEKNSPICVGLDPVYERLPKSLRGDRPSGNAEAAVEAIYQFCRGVLQTVAPHVPCVKIQSACFERYLWAGVEAYHRLMVEAAELGLIVIGDAKRGDIGISAEHYAAGDLADPKFSDLGPLRGPDALTVSAYMGPDTLEPFLKVAAPAGKGLFALVRTSNPGSDAIQSLKLTGVPGIKTVAEAVAATVAELGQAHVGKSGYSLVGAVVGATKVQDVHRLREKMPQQIFLVPGFGAQGGTAEDVRACFNEDGLGAIITASRSILYAYEEPNTSDWRGSIERATLQMKKQVQAVLVG